MVFYNILSLILYNKVLKRHHLKSILVVCMGSLPLMLLTSASWFLLLLCLQVHVWVVGSSGLIFRSPALSEKAVSKLQQMDAMFYPGHFDDLMSFNSSYEQKAQLVTLKQRDMVSIGCATALWALLCWF
jgi:hypothetical protein